MIKYKILRWGMIRTGPKHNQRCSYKKEAQDGQTVDRRGTWSRRQSRGERGREPRSVGSHHKLGGKAAPVLGLPEGAQPGQYN